ncbi:MAG: PSD1 domain-containing protein [Planctomyces sp.]|nr:PSD1 domain-containing protein [Planctomyces sp.]
MRARSTAFLGLLLASATASAADFEHDVLPALKARCFECHDGRKQIAALRLDVRSRAFRGGESGEAAIVPGKADDSPLYQRAAAEDPDLRMPPQGEGEPLTAEELAALKTWIDSGADWPEALAGDETGGRNHWAFQPPVRAEPPAVREADRVLNPIDQFVLSRLEQESLSPSEPADKATLLRRLSLDLIGLPPTIEEVDAFLADDRPDAYERQVERLLASPHYGERWGRLWLDAARYADSDGFEKDKPRFVWFYRDWVVNALNRDLPYDEFLTEQLAGDLIPNAAQDQKVATGFLRNSMINEEGGIDPEQFRMEAMFDRMDAIGKSMLGLTIQCAQCHDHKYDPISQADYYRIFAFFNNSAEGSLAVYTPDQQRMRAELFREIAEIEADLRHRTPDWAERMAAWEQSLQAQQIAWTIVKPDYDPSGSQKHYVLEDGSILAQGYAPTWHTTEFTVRTDLPKITAARLELLNDDNLPLQGPGRSIEGLAALTGFRLDAAPADDASRRAEVKVASATADANPAEAELAPIYDNRSGHRRVTGPIEYALDGNNDTAWGLDVGPGRSNVPRNAVFVLETPIENAAGSEITFKLDQFHGGWNSDDNQNNNLGRFRFSVTGDASPTADTIPARVREILAVPAAERSESQQHAVFSHWRTTVAEWKDANDRIEALWKRHPRPESQLALFERDHQRQTHLLKRGDFLKPEQTVAPGVPEFLSQDDMTQPADRLEFARWITSRDMPTTSRSIVNRVWQTLFGAGLVSTPEDLGVQSDSPSHPELLDWLAVELMEPSLPATSGETPGAWSLKHLVRLIVMSSTYRQSSAVTPELAARDPYNRLLARGSRFRVDAEIVRDVFLASAGLLNRELGGPSVYPPLPEFMLQPPVSYGPKTWPEDTGPNRYRRALYTFRFRSIPYPVLQTFDAPNGDFACVRRPRSNTPLQALMTLNEPIFLEAAQALALRTLRDGGASDAERLAFAFRNCLSRHPSDAEARVLLGLLGQERERFSQAEAKPWEFFAREGSQGSILPNTVTPAEAAAWTAVSRVLLNLDETITRE